MNKCDPKTCEGNPQNNSKGLSNGFANFSGCASCPEFFLKRSFLGQEMHTTTPEEWREKTKK